jgi:hypothetical protein
MRAPTALFERLESSRELCCVICGPWSDFHKRLIVLAGRYETRISEDEDAGEGHFESCISMHNDYSDS